MSVSPRLVVEHPQLGGGLLMATPLSLGSGLPMVARFASGLHSVGRQSLTMIDGSAWPGLPAAHRPETLSVWQRRATRWLEALRLGTVSGGQGDLFTVGREAELAQIERDLEATLTEGGACRVFCGAYGVGKSHLLAELSRRARHKGLAVTRVVLDRQRVSACRPRRLYREIVAGLCLPGKTNAGAAALAETFEAALAGQCSMLGECPWERHPYFTPLLQAWQGLDALGDEEGRSLKRELLYWISGGERTDNRRLRSKIRRCCGRDSGALYAIKDHRTVWNQLTSLLTGLACLLRESGLAQALVVILDEAEMCAVESSADQRHGDRALTGLAAAALGGRSVRRPDMLRELGGHQVTREFPAFHRGRNHLYLALGMATRTSGREILEKLLPPATFVSLEPLSPNAVSQLLERILRSYRQAFPHFELGAGFAQPLGRLVRLGGQGASSPRQIVQQALAFLDGARLWPGSIEAYIEECLQSR